MKTRREPKNPPISVRKEHELLLKLEKAGLTDELAQRVISSKDNKLAKAMCAVLGVDTEQGDRFTFTHSFNIVVPPDYNHATCLAVAKKDHGAEFAYWNLAITDENFTRSTTKLVAGRKFVVKVFQISGSPSSEDCLAFLRSQKAVLVGAQGASLAYEQGKDKLPTGCWFISFDEKDALWKDAVGVHGVPSVTRYSDGDFEFYLDDFGSAWHGNYCVLCFCDE